MEMALEFGLFFILMLCALPAGIAFVHKTFPSLNIIHAGGLGIVIVLVIYLILQKLFGKGEFKN